ncbi:MAG: hypothetical protein FNT29_09865 [Halothiobacillaceae bacterium]|nr:MAG: hypothetical protein FNT29_09865 [Halothiobacillaceae bacterium]
MMNNINLSFWMMIGWLQANMTAVVIVLVLLVALYGALIASRRGLFNGKAFVCGIGVAAVAWPVFAAILPSLTGSSLAEVSYSTDYVMLGLMSAGFAGVVFLLVYPLLVMMLKKG